uniref:Rab effector MyRIP/Melanophilin domain-containing protein n=1 Tax=Chrysemys picta bellii TaxID=8478 RepID=A0A8C3HU66_CHRPI
MAEFTACQTSTVSASCVPAAGCAVTAMMKTTSWMAPKLSTTLGCARQSACYLFILLILNWTRNIPLNHAVNLCSFLKLRSARMATSHSWTSQDAGEDTSRKETMIAEADLAAVFHQILQEQGQHMTPPEQEFSTEVRLTVNSRRKSLERNPKPGSPWTEQHRPQYSADMDTSDEDIKGAQKIPVYQPHHVKRRNRASSQESINHSGNQIFELNKRMSAIERMLNRLEERILVHSEESPAPESHTDADVEEEELKRKLEELASNISDKGVSSEEDEEKKKGEPKPEMSSPRSDPPSDAQKVCTTAGKTSGLDQTPRDLEERARHSGTTDSELSELEDKVASAAVQMQRAESEVSDIESRIAALSAAGLTVKPVEKPKKKYSTQLFMLQPPRNAGSSPGDQSTDSSEMALPDDFKVMSMPQVLRRKFNSSLEIADGDESFDRNSIYRGSLTQRNPNGKNRKADRIFAVTFQTLTY